MELEIVLSVIILVVLGFLATVDMAFAYTSDVTLRRISSEAEDADSTAAAIFLREIIDNRPKFRFALSSAIQVLLICFAVLVTLIVMNFTRDHAVLLGYSLLITVVATVTMRQIVPRLLVRSDTERKLLLLLPAVKPLYRIGSVIAAPFVAAPHRGERSRLEQTVAPNAPDERGGTAGAEDTAADDFQALIEVGEAEGIIEESERELIETMVEFSETRAGEIMTPRTEICALPIDATIRKARDLIIDQKYSRLPVYRDTIDNIEGVIYVRDLLQAWQEGAEDRPVSTILRDVLFVPETKPANDLLKAMQTSHAQFAVVVDEYGGVAGVVTVEDILEEIVGEIEDEDIEEEEIIEIVEGEGGGYYDVLGSTEIDKIERIFDLEIEDDDEFTTIAGLVTSEAGYVPRVGEKLNIRGLEIEILRADEKKLSLLRLRRQSEASEEAAADAA
ncbi:MAG: hemolysin family protein [Pyrinomonadaceae bacterium]